MHNHMLSNNLLRSQNSGVGELWSSLLSPKPQTYHSLSYSLCYVAMLTAVQSFVPCTVDQILNVLSCHAVQLSSIFFLGVKPSLYPSEFPGVTRYSSCSILVMCPKKKNVFLMRVISSFCVITFVFKDIFTSAGSTSLSQFADCLWFGPVATLAVT